MLDPNGDAKLRQHSHNSPYIEVVTYDDVVIAANNLYLNIHYR